MRKLIVTICLSTLCAASAIACGATSNEDQRRALTHQQNSDDAAKRGQYGIAGEEQRNAQDAHYEAVKKAIDEGSPIPPQPKRGDVPPPPDP